MRHRRCQLPTYAQYLARNASPSTRRLLAARKAIEKARASWGLFAGQMEFEEPEERIARIDEGVAQRFQWMRDQRAAAWKRGRAALRAVPEPRRSALLAWWNSSQCWLPAGSEYFCDWLYRVGVLRRRDTGELIDEFEARVFGKVSRRDPITGSSLTVAITAPLMMKA